MLNSKTVFTVIKPFNSMSQGTETLLGFMLLFTFPITVVERQANSCITTSVHCISDLQFWNPVRPPKRIGKENGISFIYLFLYQKELVLQSQLLKLDMKLTAALSLQLPGEFTQLYFIA